MEFDEANDRYISITYLEKSRPKELDVFMRQRLSAIHLSVRLHSLAPADHHPVRRADAHLHGSLQHALLSEFQHLVSAGRQILFCHSLTRDDHAN